MSISSLLNIGSRAMAASYAQLTVTGNNIANANTPGYSRQTADLETSFSQQTGSGFFGSGVDVKTVTRAHSDFLTREASTSTAIAAADDARSTQLQQLENVFPTDEAGLGYAAQQAFNSFVDVANDPQDPSGAASCAGPHRRHGERLLQRLEPRSMRSRRAYPTSCARRSRRSIR